MAQSGRSHITRRGCLVLGLTYMAAFVVNLFYRPQQGQTTPIPDTAGVFPFDLGVALLENPTSQVNNYNNKKYEQFLPFIGR